MARIAFLIPDLGGGGAERVAVTLIEGFVERGHEVDVLLLRKSGQFLDMLPPEARVVDLRAARSRNAILPLWRYLRSTRPDGLQISMWSLTVLGVIVGRIALGRGLRIVTSDHASLSRQFAGSRLTLMAIRLSVRLVYPLADARICVSSGTADDLARLSGLRRETFEVVYNPIPGPEARVEVPREVEANWTGEAGRIVAVGSLKLQKNHELLLRAFALVVRRRPASLIIAGAGVLRERLEQVAQAEGISGHVTFAGFTTDIWPFYASADLFVLSSDYEGFGNVIVEAMHMGLPIVSTDCPDGPAEILGHGEYGALVPCGDIEALADAMDTALGQRSAPDRQKSRALYFDRARAVGHYLRWLVPDIGA